MVKNAIWDAGIPSWNPWLRVQLYCQSQLPKFQINKENVCLVQKKIFF